MKKATLYLLLICLTVVSYNVSAQEKGILSGGFEANANIFLRDSLIGAANIPQYDNEKFGSEGWFNLNYRVKGFDMGIRFDYFNNSNLLNPNDSYTDQGIGRWYVKKRTDKLEIGVGYLYDQIGSGIIYRAWESRPLLIDNALYGASVKYDLTEDINIRAFTGQQKFLFGQNPGIIKGVAVDGFFSFGEEKPFSISPGIGFVNRTLSEDNVGDLVNIVKNYVNDEQIKLQYNVYLMSGYATMSYDKFTMYVEAAYKSPEAFFDPLALRTEITGVKSFGKYVREAGTVFYGSLSYANKGLGVTVEAKRTENFNFRSDPTLNQNFGLVNFLPPMNRQNTYRLTSRYSPATQDLSEFGYQADISYKFNRKFSANANFSKIVELDGGEDLYQEIYGSLTYKASRSLQMTGGLQLQSYNQDLYEQKPTVPMLETVTPFVDILYKFTRKKSIRVEAQYMSTEQDYGSWAFLLAEVGLAPNWIFEASGMYNVSPNAANSDIPRDPETNDLKKILYPTLGVVYVKKSNRYNIRYVKQVEGVVCSGGICRLEPAFSGVKMSVTSTF